MAAEAPGAGQRRGPGPALRRVARAMAVVALPVLGAGGFLLFTEPGSRWLIQRTLPLVNLALPGATLELDGFRTDGVRGLTLEGLRLMARDGHELVGLDRLDVEWFLPDLARGDLHLRLVELRRPRIALAPGAEGRLDLLEALGIPPSTEEPAGPWEGLPLGLRVDSFLVRDGVASYRQGDTTWSLTEVAATLSIRGSGRTLLAESFILGARLQSLEEEEPGLDHRLALAGTFGLEEGDLRISPLRARLGDAGFQVEGSVLKVQETPLPDLSMRLWNVDPDLLSALTGHVPVRGPLDLEGRIHGPLDALALEATLVTPGGTLPLTGGGDLLASPPTWHAEVGLDALDVATLLEPVTGATVLTGSLEVTGSGTVWPAGIRARATLDLGPGLAWGQDLSGLRGTATLEEGRLTLSDLDLGAALGSGTGGGTLDLANGGGSLTLALRDLDLPGLARFGVEGVRGRGGVTGELVLPGPGEEAIRLVGRLDVRSPGYGPWVEATSASGPVTVLYEAGRTVVSGDLEAHGVAVSGVEAARVTGPWSVEVAPDGAVSFSATPALAGVDAMGVTLERALLEVRGATSDTSPLQVGAHGTGAQLRWAGIEARNVTTDVSLSGDLLDVSLLATSPDPARPADPPAEGASPSAPPSNEPRKVVSTHLQMDLARGRLTAWPLEVNPSPLVHWEATEAVTLTWAENGLEGLVAVLESQPGAPDTARLTVRGSLDPEGPVDLHAEVRDVTLNPLVPLVPFLPKDLSGVTRLRLDIGGQADALVLDGTGSVRGLGIPGLVRDLDADLSFTGGPQGVDLHLDLPQPLLASSDGTPASPGEEGQEKPPPKPVAVPPKEGVLAPPDRFLLRGDAHLPVRLALASPGLDLEAPWSADLELGPGALERWEPLLDGLDLPVADLSGRLQVGGTPLAPTVRFSGAGEVPIGARNKRLRMDLGLAQEGQDLTLDAVFQEDMRRQATIRGTARTRLGSILTALAGGPVPEDARDGFAWADPATWANDLDVEINPVGLDADAVRGFVSLPSRLSGELMGGVRVTGHPLSPVVTGGLLVSQGRIGDVSLSPLYLSVEPDPTGYTVQAVVGFQDDTGLEITGRVPLKVDLEHPEASQVLDQQGLDLQVSGSGIPLRILSSVVPDLSFSEGILQVGGSVGGCLSEPELDLSMTLKGVTPANGKGEARGGSFGWKTTGVRYDNVQVQARVEKNRVAIQRLSAATRSLHGSVPTGHVQLAGSMLLEDWVPTHVSIHGETRQFIVSDIPLARLAVTGDVDIQGAWPGIQVSGDLRVDEAHLVADEALWLYSGTLELDPGLTIHRPGASQDAVEEAPAPPWYQDVVAHADLDLGDKSRVVVRMPIDDTFGAVYASLATVSLDTWLTGELEVGYRDATLEVRGEVQSPRGRATVLNSDFDWENAPDNRVSFAGGDPYNPILDLAASRDVGAYGTVGVRIQGDVENPRITFNSEDWPDETDVVSLLVLGRPLSELSGEEGQVNANLLSLAAGALAGQLERSLGSSFFDMVQIDASTSGGFGAIRVGRAIGDGVFLILTVRPEADVNAGENLTEATVQWTISRRWVLDVVTGDQGSSSADLYRTWRY